MVKSFWKTIKKADKLALLAIIALGLVKLINLNGGVALGEPDEIIHLEALRNFRSGEWWPVFAGKGWYYNFPLFLYLGWPLSYFFGEGLLTYRLISVLFSVFLSLGIYFYLRWKGGVEGKGGLGLGLVGALFWSLCPFAVYYSRLGLIEMMVTSLMFLALFSFDYAISEKSLKWSLVSGALLSLAVLTKYTAFTFVVAMVLVLVARSTKKLSQIGRIGLMRLIDLYSLVPLAIAGVATLAAALVFYLHDGFLFKLQAGASLGIFTDFWKDVSGGYWELWWQKTAWWVGWPILVLATVGFVSLGLRGIRGLKGWGIFALTFLVGTFLITTRRPFNPRYFLPVVPFLCIYAALGAQWVLAKLPRKTRRVFGDSTRRVGELAIFLGILGSLLSSSLTAFKAANHTLVEEAGFFVRANSQKLTANSYLFSNWWPTFFEESSGLEATWLAESVKETEELASTNNRSALTVLAQEGGAVLLEQLYYRSLYTPNVRQVAQDLVERNVEPAVTIKDLQPNFPFYKESYNQIKIYLIEPGQEFP